MEIVYLLIPYLLGALAFISSLRAFLWVSDRVEDKISKKFKEKSISKLEKWWDKIISIKFPELAVAKSQLLLDKVNPFLKNERDLTRIKLTTSLFLTTIAYLIGHVILIISISIDYLFFDLANDFDFNFTSFLLTNPICFPAYILLTYRLLKVFKSTQIEIEELFEIFFQFLILSAILKVILSQIYWGFSFIDSLKIVALGFLYLLEIKLLRKSKKIIRMSILVVFTILMTIFSKYLIVFILGLILLYFFNYVFDSVTFKVNYKIFQKIAVGNSAKNLFWLLSSIFVSSCLAFIVYILVLLNWRLEVFLSFGEWGISDFQSLLNSLKKQMNHSIDQNAFCIILYSATTLIPIILLSILLILSYSAKTTYLFVGRFSRFIFYNQDKEKKKSPIHMTLVLIAFWLSIIPGIFAYVSTAKKISEMMN